MATEPLMPADCVHGFGRLRAIHRPSGAEGIVCSYSYRDGGPTASTGLPVVGSALVTIALDHPRSTLEAPLADFDRAD